MKFSIDTLQKNWLKVLSGKISLSFFKKTTHERTRENETACESLKTKRQQSLKSLRWLQEKDYVFFMTQLNKLYENAIINRNPWRRAQYCCIFVDWPSHYKYLCVYHFIYAFDLLSFVYESRLDSSMYFNKYFSFFRSFYCMHAWVIQINVLFSRLAGWVWSIFWNRRKACYE